jgi:hypothetical protein
MRAVFESSMYHCHLSQPNNLHVQDKGKMTLGHPLTQHFRQGDEMRGSFAV